MQPNFDAQFNMIDIIDLNSELISISLCSNTCCALVPKWHIHDSIYVSVVG